MFYDYDGLAFDVEDDALISSGGEYSDIITSPYVAHYGMPRRSGRYPWGSGKNPYQSSKNFLGYVDDMRAKGLTEKEVWASMGMNSREYREYTTRYNAEKKYGDFLQIKALKEKGLPNVKIAEMLSIPEATVRNRLRPQTLDKYNKLQSTKAVLEEALKEHPYISVGRGVSEHMNVSPEYLKMVVSMMEDEGWQRHLVNVQQMSNPNPNNQTRDVVLAPPGTTSTEIKRNLEKVGIPGYRTQDHGLSYKKISEPVSVDSKRIDIVYGPEGGSESDGLIKLRPGVSDLDLGGKNYAQVRIAVDGTHFLKGMAVYDTTLPKGVDIQVFSNKPRPADGDKHKAMKPMKIDPLTQEFDPATKEPVPGTGAIDRQNPFGTAIKAQSGVLNIVYNEGAWTDWSKNLPAQMLSKQGSADSKEGYNLAKQQLAKVVDKRKAELAEYMAMTNPVVKQYLLEKFATAADSDAVDLKAAKIDKQSTAVILPINSLAPPTEGRGGKVGKPGEIFAPGLPDGTEVVLVRFPHSGTFEIPTLRVNNNNAEARRIIGLDAKDAVGIHHKVAAQLSGADFDGDAVLVIPNDKTGINRIKTTAPLQELRGFDPSAAYPKPEGVEKLQKINTQKEMGVISNLITDMTIMGAPHSDIAKAVKHSMVVIDAEKHELDWKRSEVENQIDTLKKTWRTKEDGTPGGGAATLISRAGADIRIPQRRLANVGEGGPIDPKTGELRWTDTGKTYRVPKINKRTGDVTWIEKPRLQVIERLAYETDARNLMSSKTGTLIERIYADHSNALKALANRARLDSLKIENMPYNPSAFKVYRKEVDELMAGVRESRAHAPLERKAQATTKTILQAIQEASPGMDKKTTTKMTQRILSEQRAIFGARPRIKVEPRHWEAIQSGAISAHALRQILNATDLDIIKEYATPRAKQGLSPSQLARARSMSARGDITQADIAQALGVSVSTLNRALMEG